MDVEMRNLATAEDPSRFDGSGYRDGIATVAALVALLLGPILVAATLIWGVRWLASLIHLTAILPAS